MCQGPVVTLTLLGTDSKSFADGLRCRTRPRPPLGRTSLARPAAWQACCPHPYATLRGRPSTISTVRIVCEAHDACRRPSPARGDKGQCWLQIHARLLKPTIKVRSQTCVCAVGSAQSCVGQGILIPCASSYRAPPRDRRCGLRSCPAPRSFDRAVFFASGWLG